MKSDKDTLRPKKMSTSGEESRTILCILEIFGYNFGEDFEPVGPIRSRENREHHVHIHKVREKTSIEPRKRTQQVFDFWIQELTVDHDGTKEMLIQNPEL